MTFWARDWAFAYGSLADLVGLTTGNTTCSHHTLVIFFHLRLDSASDLRMLVLVPNRNERNRRAQDRAGSQSGVDGPSSQERAPLVASM